MDDRWLIVYEAPYLFFHRSWTGVCVYRVTLAEQGEGFAVSTALWARELVKSSQPDDLEREARVLDALVRHVLLGEPPPEALPAPEEPEPTLRGRTGPQPVIESPPAPVSAPRPWWKLWG